MKRAFLSLMMVVSALSATIAFAVAANAATSHPVTIQGFAFNPQEVDVNVGDTVVWTNADAATHTVTSGQFGVQTGVFSSGNVASGGTFSHTFDTAGSFPYYCRIHDEMTGVINVTDAAPPVSVPEAPVVALLTGTGALVAFGFAVRGRNRISAVPAA
jgi:plastocyanin